MVNFDDFKKSAADAAEKAADAAEKAVDSIGNAAKSVGGDALRAKRFADIGYDLFTTGAVTSHGGNLSETDGTNIWISKTGAMLGHILPGDVRRTGWEASESDEGCSCELVVHRALYHALMQAAQAAGAQFTPKAIVHAHTLHTTFRSMIETELKPVDSEGVFIFTQPVPVVTAAQTIASEEVATALSALVCNGARIAVVRGHGPFAVADTLEEAFRLVSCLEHTCHLADLFEMTGRSLFETDGS